ncbi:Transcription factor BTF3 4 [Balamuthia mandrillaris]
MGHEVRRFPVEQVRTGGKGSVRRKGKKGKGKSNNNVLANSGNKKNPTKTLAEKVGLYPVGDVSEVNMFLEDGSVLHFERPEVSSSFPSYTMTIQGSPQKKVLGNNATASQPVMNGTFRQQQVPLKGQQYLFRFPTTAVNPPESGSAFEMSILFLDTGGGMRQNVKEKRVGSSSSLVQHNLANGDRVLVKVLYWRYIPAADGTSPDAFPLAPAGAPPSDSTSASSPLANATTIPKPPLGSTLVSSKVLFINDNDYKRDVDYQFDAMATWPTSRRNSHPYAEAPSPFPAVLARQSNHSTGQKLALKTIK